MLVIRPMRLFDLEKEYQSIVQDKQSYIGKLFTHVKAPGIISLVLDLKIIQNTANCFLVIVYLTKDKKAELWVRFSRFCEYFEEIK